MLLFIELPAFFCRTTVPSSLLGSQTFAIKSNLHCSAVNGWVLRERHERKITSLRVKSKQGEVSSCCVLANGSQNVSFTYTSGLSKGNPNSYFARVSLLPCILSSPANSKSLHNSCWLKCNNKFFFFCLKMMRSHKNTADPPMCFSRSSK